MTRLFTICAAVSLSFGSFARAQDIPAEYQQVLTTLGKTRRLQGECAQGQRPQE